MTVTRHTAPPIAVALLLVGLLIASTALAQPYQNANLGISFTVPAGWELSDEIDDELDMFVTMLAPSQMAGIVVGGKRLTAEERADGGIGARDADFQEAVSEIGTEFPGARPTRQYERPVAGQAARGFDFESPDMHGTLLYAVTGDVLVMIAVFAVPTEIAATRSHFETLVTSFAAAGASAGPGPSGPTNPLGLGGDPWVGTFRGDQLEMTLQGGGGSYEGQLLFQGQAFPVRAQGGPGQLSGTFASGGSEFAFTATERDGSVTLVTGGTTYLLRR